MKKKTAIITGVTGQDGSYLAKLLIKKDGEFAGTCASNNPMFKDDSGSCSVCGARPSEQCLNEDGKEVSR